MHARCHKLTCDLKGTKEADNNMYDMLAKIEAKLKKYVEENSCWKASLDNENWFHSPSSLWRSFFSLTIKLLNEGHHCIQYVEV